jgi:hypothetical protein
MVTWTNSWKPIYVNPDNASSPGLNPAGSPMKKIAELLFTRENLFALLLCLILMALVIFTADTSPTWIYQGF